MVDAPRLNGVARAVSCVGVGKIWNAGSKLAHEALTDIELEIEAGEFVVLLGPSGCGKSTLLCLIAGLEEPTSGVISAYGEPITGPAPERSLIFQETSLFPWLNVWQNVSFGLSVRGVPTEERKETARQVLGRVGLSDAFDKHPDELSGGMRQRVAVARALAMQPKVLLMDEPFAALDVQTRVKMQDFLLDVWDVSKASVLFVTHHIDEAARARRPRRRIDGTPRPHQGDRADRFAATAGYHVADPARVARRIDLVVARRGRSRVR